MKISELKTKLDYYVDSIYQAGYDMGFDSVLEDFEAISDNLWNQGLELEAEAIRTALTKIRATSDENYL